MVIAVVLAFADGFPLTSLAGAVGAILRTRNPVAAWPGRLLVLLANWPGWRSCGAAAARGSGRPDGC